MGYCNWKICFLLFLFFTSLLFFVANLSSWFFVTALSGSASTMVIPMCLIGCFTLLEEASAKRPRLSIWVKTYLLVKKKLFWVKKTLSCILYMILCYQWLTWLFCRIQFYIAWRQCNSSWVHTSWEGERCGPQSDFYVWGENSQRKWRADNESRYISSWTSFWFFPDDVMLFHHNWFLL